MDFKLLNLSGQCADPEIVRENFNKLRRFLLDLLGTGSINEIVPFTAVAELTLEWTEERVTNFGAAGVFQVEIAGDDGQVRVTTIEIKPDNILATTSYHFDFGGVATGRIVIT